MEFQKYDVKEKKKEKKERKNEQRKTNKIIIKISQTEIAYSYFKHKSRYKILSMKAKLRVSLKHLNDFTCKFLQIQCLTTFVFYFFLTII